MARIVNAQCTQCLREAEEIAFELYPQPEVQPHGTPVEEMQFEDIWGWRRHTFIKTHTPIRKCLAVDIEYMNHQEYLCPRHLL